MTIYFSSYQNIDKYINDNYEIKINDEIIFSPEQIIFLTVPPRKIFRKMRSTSLYNNAIAIPPYSLTAHNKFIGCSKEKKEKINFILNESNNEETSSIEYAIFTLSYVVSLATANINFLYEGLNHKLILSSELAYNYYARMILIGYLSYFGMECIELDLNQEDLIKNDVLKNYFNLKDDKDIIEANLHHQDYYVQLCQKKVIDNLKSIFQIKANMYSKYKTYMSVDLQLFLEQKGFIPNIDFYTLNHYLKSKFSVEQVTLFDLLISSEILLFVYKYRHLLDEIDMGFSLPLIDDLDENIENTDLYKKMKDIDKANLIQYIKLVLSRQSISAKYIQNFLETATLMKNP